MESVFGRHRNLIILLGVLFLQGLGLAVQIKRNVENEPTRLIRIWTVNAVAPFEKAIVWAQAGVSGVWHNYFYLRGVRQENRQLKAEIQELRLEQVRLNEDAEQARRLQMLLGFKEQYISKTQAAQVIGSSGSEQSRVIYIDKGSSAGIKSEMPVITAQGVVGKVLRAYDGVSQVLLINDQSSGVGAILEKSRLQGVLRGTAAGELVLEKVMSDEQVQPGEEVLTSGGDQIFPKGFPVGVVTKVSQTPDLFLNIKIRPSANLSKLEEVLVVTKVDEKIPAVAQTGPVRAVDILAQRLPSVPDGPPQDPNKPPPPTSGLVIAPAPKAEVNAAATAKPPVSAPAPKPCGNVKTPQMSSAPVSHQEPAAVAKKPANVLPASGPVNAKPPAVPAVTTSSVQKPETTVKLPAKPTTTTDQKPVSVKPKPQAPPQSQTTTEAPPQ
jgi:rod shape-determining protein MreC